MKIKLPDIPESEQTLVVKGLLLIIEQLAKQSQRQQEEINLLKDEINILKGQKKRPVFKPGKLDETTDKQTSEQDKDNRNNKRPGSTKKNKNQQLTIHQDKIIQPDMILPLGTRFKGYRDFIVQELDISPRNIRYRLAYYQLPDGSTVTAKLSKGQRNNHFGVALRSYILYQYHQCQVTQPLLLEQLREWGIDISTGQLNVLLTENHTGFHSEKDALLAKGLMSTGYITTDDTGARHQGKNGYVTHIGNEWFAWFKSSDSKSRINFLSILRAGRSEYQINDVALCYMKEQGLPATPLAAISNSPAQDLENKTAWEAHLKRLGVNQKRHIRIATEGALLGSVLHGNTIQNLAVISDGAGQFNVLQHGLCWVHAERLIHKLIPLNDSHRKDIEKVRGEIWTLYAGLKDYKKEPTETKKVSLSADFDRIFIQKTSYQILNELLKRLNKNKEALLLVLERPEIPIHTNGSENDLREQVKRRKVSGGTRSALGRKCRDTFSSLKKTCRKLSLSFWDFLLDRLNQEYMIPELGDLVIQKAQTASGY